MGTVKQIEEFEEACATGNLEKVKNLFPFVEDHIEIDYLLYEAAVSPFIGSEGVVEFLLKHGANPNLEDLLHTSCTEGEAEIVKLLLKYGANPNKGVVLYSCCEAQVPNMEIIKLLLEHGADPNAPGVLYAGCYYDNLDLVKLLLKYKANPLIIDYEYIFEKVTVFYYLINCGLVSAGWIKEHSDAILAEVWNKIYE
jgi:ankyrin repeat protein